MPPTLLQTATKANELVDEMVKRRPEVMREFPQPDPGHRVRRRHLDPEDVVTRVWIELSDYGVVASHKKASGDCHPLLETELQVIVCTPEFEINASETRLGHA